MLYISDALTQLSEKQMKTFKIYACESEHLNCNSI